MGGYAVAYGGSWVRGDVADVGYAVGGGRGEVHASCIGVGVGRAVFVAVAVAVTLTLAFVVQAGGRGAWAI